MIYKYVFKRAPNYVCVPLDKSMEHPSLECVCHMMSLCWNISVPLWYQVKSTTKPPLSIFLSPRCVPLNPIHVMRTIASIPRLPNREYTTYMYECNKHTRKAHLKEKHINSMAKESSARAKREKSVVSAWREAQSFRIRASTQTEVPFLNWWQTLGEKLCSLSPSSPRIAVLSHW